MIYMYKVHHKLLPNHLVEMFVTVGELHSHETRQKNTLKVPRTKTSVAEYFLSVTGAKLWNEYSQSVDIDGGIGQYKRSLKLEIHVRRFKTVH